MSVRHRLPLLASPWTALLKTVVCPVSSFVDIYGCSALRQYLTLHYVCKFLLLVEIKQRRQIEYATQWLHFEIFDLSHISMLVSEL